MFQFFRNALDTQNEELKMLHNEVTELERVNSEILDFVHKNGRLPEIVSRPIRILLLKINERGNLELASNKDDIGVYRGSESNHDDKHQQLETVTRRSPNSSVITDVISKNAEELSRVLMSLGLESSKSNHIVDHIQKNMDNVVNTDTTAYESQLDFDKKTTCLTPQRGIDSPISEIVDVSDHNESPANPECSGDDSNQSRNDGQPQYSFPPTISTVTYELRRRELLRANQRIALNPSYSLNNSTEGLTGHISYHQSMPSSLSAQLPSSECRAICIPDNHSLHYFNSNPNTTMSLSDSVLRYCIPEKSNTDETNANGHSLSCPCGNPQSCPLSEQKIERLCKNPGIIHGFTVLSAVFRGRLTRQLLATRKVHDLIRTVKDTAKLILSIRLDQRNISFQSEFISTNKTIRQLTNNELLLESKLLIQLYNILNEIHEIFFKWSITKQISLICNSNLSSYKMDYSFTKLTNQTSTNSLRILRQLQPHQVNSLPKSKQINNNANGEEKKSNISIISNKRNPYHSINNNNNNNNNNNKLINKFSPKQQLTHNINKNQLKNNQKECYKQQSISNTFIQSNINNSIYYKSINKTNQYITRSISTNNTLNNKVNRSSSIRKNYINRTKSIEPKIIRHFSNKIDPIQYNNNNSNNTSTIDSLNSNNNNNDPLNITVNSELEIHSKNGQYTSTLKSTNISTDVNNFPNIKTTHTEKCHETVVEEKRLSTSSKQVSSSTLSQCGTNLHAPLTINDNNNNTSVQRCFPVKRRILSRKLKNDYSNNPIHVSTQNNSSNSTCNNYNNDVSFLIQDNQSINNTLHSNDNEIKYNYEISNNLYQKNSELRATWTLDSKTYPSLTIDTINLSN